MSRLIVLLWNALGRMLERRSLDMLAESCFRKAVESAPSSHAESRLRLGRLLLTQKRYSEALALLEAAVSVKAGSAESWNAIGVARRETGNMAGAGDAFRHALEANPDLIQAHNNFGNWLLAKGEAGQALSWFDKALAASPDFYETLNNRIVALLDLGRSAEAEEAAKDALERYPGSAPLHLNLGNSYLQQVKAYLALQSYKKALELEPGFEEAHFNYSLIEGAPEHLANALHFLEAKIAVHGRSADLLSRLAVAYMANSSFSEAEKVCCELLSRLPDFAPAYITLGNVLSHMGDSGQALHSYQRALRYTPDDSRVHSNVLFELNYSPDYSSEFIFGKHLEWAARHEQPLAPKKKNHSPGSEKNRRLKIGYVSPDFLSHPVGHLIRGVIRHHDKEKFEIHCYARVARTDHITEEIKQNADAWHDTVGLSDAEVVGRIVEDKIDILVDLTGHTASHRLLVFAQKPAPIQVSWIGYFHSTGMESIDYFITDPFTSPKGSGQFFSETPVWLPHTRFCYTPPDYVPPVADPPCLRNGFVTLGCFNKLAKVTDEVVRTWAQIMHRLPDARLWLKSSTLKEPSVCDAVRAKFAALGTDPSRVILKPASGHEDMLKEYGEIDIALDPFPFSGGMTTFEALLMGVPVVTLARQAVVARQSASALANLGRSDLIHETISSYVDGVVGLASDKQKLADLRWSLRPTMERSALCDIQGFTRDLEDLYRRMWHAWCDNGKLPSALC